MCGIGRALGLWGGGMSAYGWCVSITAASAIQSLLTRKKPHPGTPAAPSCDVSHASDMEGLLPPLPLLDQRAEEATAAAAAAARFGSSPSHNTGAPPPRQPKPLDL